MKVNDIRRIIFPLCMCAYIFAFVVASAGAVNYAFQNNAHIYTVAGILNLICGGYSTYRVYKTHMDEKYTLKK